MHIDGGLHSTEVAGAQQSILLAYKLVSTQGDPEIDAILDNVILMLWPTLNPDGQDEVVSWYRKNLGTPYEVSPAARSLSGVRGPRQQSRRLHEQHAGIARRHHARSSSGTR